MSKKDYQAIASKLWELRPISAARTEPGSDWWRCVQGMADVLAADSPRFDRARFLEACETGTTKGMKKAG